MTTIIQKFLLNNTKFLQNLVNNKLANSGPGKKFWRWMEIGPRGYGSHNVYNYFRALNSFFMVVGQRFNWHRPHLIKQIFSKEREIFLTGYSIALYVIFLFYKRNFIAPQYTNNDAYLYNYDNPNYFSQKYKKIIPGYVSNYRTSAHYLEINKIFQREMLKHYEKYAASVASEFNDSSEKVQRTKFASNPNYVYEPFGWEN